MTLVELRSVEKVYGGRTVLRGLEMKVTPGARIGLIGANGTGKSTLLRILADLEEVDSGALDRTFHKGRLPRPEPRATTTGRDASGPP